MTLEYHHVILSSITASGVTNAKFARSYHAGTMMSQKTLAVHDSRLLEKTPLPARSPLTPPVPEQEFSRQTLAVKETNSGRACATTRAMLHRS